MKNYMKHKETDFSIKFRHWLKNNKRQSCTFELKDSRGKNYFNFSELKEEQINYALSVQSDKGTLIRLQAITGGEPDYVYYRNSPAYIVINYPECFCIIPINNLLFEKEKSKRKSLTEERAKEIAIKVVKK